MKKYITPTYEVVRINKKDVIATSVVQSVESNADFIFGGGWNGYARGADRGFYDWDAGY